MPSSANARRRARRRLQQLTLKPLGKGALRYASAPMHYETLAAKPLGIDELASHVMCVQKSYPYLVVSAANRMPFTVNFIRGVLNHIMPFARHMPEFTFQQLFQDCVARFNDARVTHLPRDRLLFDIVFASLASIYDATFVRMAANSRLARCPCDRCL